MKYYRIQLLGTAEGVNLKKDKSKDIITVFLWAENGRKARELARKMAASLAVPTHVGMLEYIVKSICRCSRPLTRNEKKMLKASRKDIGFGGTIILL